MKKLFIVLFALLSNFIAICQEKQPDLLIKHSGEVMRVVVSNVTEKDITFTYPNETVINTISKNMVKEIQFSSGRIQKITERVIVTGEDDWEKVTITNNPDDVIGLVRKGEVRAKASNDWNFKSVKGVAEKAEKKIKKEAAEMKAHIILITEQTTKDNSFFSSAKSFKSGVAYGYE